jgi:hypothetical protein
MSPTGGNEIVVMLGSVWVCVSRISILECSFSFLLHSFFNLLGVFDVGLHTLIVSQTGHMQLTFARIVFMGSSAKY